MRVLMISDFYHPYLGGVEQHVRNLGAELAVRGHEVSVATLADGNLPTFEMDGPVRVHRIPSSFARASGLFKSADRRWAPPFPDPEATAALARITRDERPDIVHGHDWLLRSFLPLKPFGQAKLVAGLHYYSLSCAKKDLQWHGEVCTGPRLGKCVRCAAAHYGALKGTGVTTGNFAGGVLERAMVDMYLPVSEAVARGNRLREDGARFTVIPNFVSDRPGETPRDVATYMKRLPAEPFLLFVGDMRAYKGIDVLLEAYSLLANPPALVLIGKPWPETPVVVPRNVRVHENWPNAAVLAAWERAYAGIVPSIGPEAFGLVAIEALSRGCPVIASNIGGLPEIITDGRDGLLTPPGDAAALAAAISRLTSDSTLRARLAETGKARAGDFAASRIVPQIEHVYDGLLREPQHSSRLRRQQSHEAAL